LQEELLAKQLAVELAFSFDRTILAKNFNSFCLKTLAEEQLCFICLASPFSPLGQALQDPGAPSCPMLLSKGVTQQEILVQIEDNNQTIQSAKQYLCIILIIFI